jgi:hypothetical protein
MSHLSLNNIIYRPALWLGDSHRLIKHSVFSYLTQYSSSNNNPMFSTVQRTVISEQGDFAEFNPLDVDTTGHAAAVIAEATPFEFGATELTKGATVKRKGMVYTVAKTCTITNLADFHNSLFSGDLVPVLKAHQSNTVAPSYVRFNDVSLRGESQTRYSALAISHEAVTDIAAYGNDPDRVIREVLLIPALNDVDREVVFRAIGMAKKSPAIAIAATTREARNLLIDIEQKRQQVFKETGRTPSVCVCSTPVMGLLLGTGMVNAYTETDLIEEEIELTDGQTQTQIRELEYIVPNRYISRTGLMFMATDPLPGEDSFNYYMLSVKTDKEDHLAPLYLHSYQPENSFTNLYEFLDPKSFQPSIRASMRYCLMAGPWFAKDTDKIIQADTDETFAKVANAHPLLSMTPVTIKPLVSAANDEIAAPVAAVKKTKKAA